MSSFCAHHTYMQQRLQTPQQYVGTSTVPYIEQHFADVNTEQQQSDIQWTKNNNVTSYLDNVNDISSANLPVTSEYNQVFVRYQEAIIQDPGPIVISF